MENGMRYVPPQTVTYSLTVDGVTHSVVYYKPPISISGVVDETHPNYAPALTYAIGAWVIVPELKKKFRAAAPVAANEHPLSFPEKWIDFGPINSYLALATDTFINGVMSCTDAVFEFDFARSNTFAIVAANFTTCRIEQLDASGSVIYDKTFLGWDYGARSFYEYLYAPRKVRSRVVSGGLKWLPNSKLRVTFPGIATIGAMVYGLDSDFGYIKKNAAVEFQDKSVISNSPITGVQSVIRYGSARIFDGVCVYKSFLFNVMCNKVESLVGRSVLWIPTIHDSFNESISIARLERMKVVMSDDEHSETPISLIGVL